MLSNGLKEWPVTCRVWPKTVYPVSLCILYEHTGMTWSDVVLQLTLLKLPAELSEGLFVNNSVRLQALVSLAKVFYHKRGPSHTSQTLAYWFATRCQSIKQTFIHINGDNLGFMQAVWAGCVGECVFATYANTTSSV
jgi:hypothetical protein